MDNQIKGYQANHDWMSQIDHNTNIDFFLHKEKLLNMKNILMKKQLKEKKRKKMLHIIF